MDIAFTLPFLNSYKLLSSAVDRNIVKQAEREKKSCRRFAAENFSTNLRFACCFLSLALDP
jgi:hypothetical protein